MSNLQAATNPFCLNERAISSGLPFTLAVSAKWTSTPDRLPWIKRHNFGLEFAPDPKAPSPSVSTLDTYRWDDMLLRFHALFQGFEIGDRDGEAAERAMWVHRRAIDAFSGKGQGIVTVHIGLTPGITIDLERAADNLAELAVYAKGKNVRVSLENLKRGPMSHPDMVKKLADQADTLVTLDVGHALSCDHLRDGNLTMPDFIDCFEERLVEVHFYEKETDRHHAPNDMRLLGPIVNRLLETRCSWWTIELDDHEDILRTERLLSNYCDALSAGSPGCQPLSNYIERQFNSGG